MVRSVDIMEPSIQREEDIGEDNEESKLSHREERLQEYKSVTDRGHFEVNSNRSTNE